MMRPGARFTLWGGKRLPYDAEVEYLQSSGTQYIDTNLYASGKSHFEVGFRGLETGNKAVMGASNGNTYSAGECAIFWNQSAFDVIKPNGANSSVVVSPRPSYTANTDYFISYDATYLIINGESQNSNWYSSYQGTRTLYLFATHRNAATVLSKMRLYSYKHYENGDLVRDFIPVRVGTVGYLYDRVSGELFGNAGTGAFAYGNDV